MTSREKLRANTTDAEFRELKLFGLDYILEASQENTEREATPHLSKNEKNRLLVEA